MSSWQVSTHEKPCQCCYQYICSMSQELWTWFMLCYVLLWFCIDWFYPNLAGLLHWPLGNHMIAELSTWLTHWGWVTHICVGNLTIIGSDNGLSPERRQAIIWTIAGILLIGPLGTNFSEIFIEIQTFSFKKIRLKMSSAKCASFHHGLNVLTQGSLLGSFVK